MYNNQIRDSLYRYICNKTGRRYLYLYWSLISAGPKAIILNAMETHLRESEHVSVGFPGLLMADLAPVYNKSQVLEEAGAAPLTTKGLVN